MSRIKQIADKVLEWSDENTAGTVMSAENIYLACRKIDNITLCNSRYIDNIVADYETKIGYLVKTSDFISAFKIF